MIEKFRALSPGLQKWLKIFFIACLLLTLLDLVVDKHGDHGWNFFGFHSAYGFVACVVLVIIATWMRKPLMRDQDYYQTDQDERRLKALHKNDMQKGDKGDD